MYINPIIRASYTNYQNRNKSSAMKKPNFQKVAFRGDVQFFDYDARLKAKLEARGFFKKLFGAGKKKAKDEVNHELLGFNINQEAIIKAKEQSIRDKEELLRQKEETLRATEREKKILEERLEEAKKNNEKDKIILMLQRQLEEVKNQSKINKEDVKAEAVKIDKLKEAQELLTKREAGKGWDRIAGYEGLKGQMEEVFINKLAQEKAGYDVQMPNGIMLYGQPGTGKTRFAEAFAQQAGCKLVLIDTMQDYDDILQDIRDELKAAKRRYIAPETQKQRTIILLDDFNSIAKLSEEEKNELKIGQIEFEDTIVGQLIEKMQNCANNEYKTTFFMTTNHPRKIESRLLNPSIIPYQIFLGPPKPVDAAKIFKYHTRDFTKQDIDYNKLGNAVARAIENEEAYSAQGIVNVVNYAREKAGNSQLTETGLLKAIKEVKPDISKKTFNAFWDDMSKTLSEYDKNSKGEK